MKICHSYVPLLALLVTVMLMVFGGEVKGQVRYKRVYANTQTSGYNPGFLVGQGSIANDNLASDNNLQTFSTITCSSLVVTQNKWQHLTFASPFSRSVPIHIKLSTEVPLNLLGGISIEFQPYSGSTALGSPTTLSAGILGLAGGVNMLDYIVPAPGGAGNYDGMRITLQVGGVAGTANIKIYEVFYDDTPAGNIVCDEKIDYIYGVAGASLLSNINEVLSPELAIDGNYTTASSLKSNLTVAASVFETAIYSSSSKPGDSIRVVFQKQTGGLLNLSVAASSFKITAFNGNTAVTTLADQSSLLDLRLLSGSSSIQTLTFPVPSGSFDRIQVSLAEGLANAITGLFLYEIERIAPKPLPTSVGIVNGKLTKCEGDAINITISNPESGSKYRWFGAPTGGTEILTGLNANGTIFSPTGLAAGTHNFYVSLSRNGCSDEMSDRAKISVIINPLPTATISGTISVCEGAAAPSITFTGSGGTALYTFSYKINNGSIQTITSNAVGIATISIPTTSTGTSTYSLISVEDSSSTHCSQLQTGSVTVTVLPKPHAPPITPNIY